jgi:hypothetical protein
LKDAAAARLKAPDICDRSNRKLPNDHQLSDRGARAWGGRLVLLHLLSNFKAKR